MTIAVRFDISIEQIETELFQMGDDACIFHGLVSCWWTHRPSQISAYGPNGFSSAPICDPRGGVIRVENDWRVFLVQARSPEALAKYGKHGIRTFLSAHHMNSYEEDSYRPWAETDWSRYDKAIDRYDLKKANPLRVARGHKLILKRP